MMSDSDDTDDLLLIPPDLFIIPSDSDDHSDYSSYIKTKSSVVSELVQHMQTLESRIFAIESKESSNNSLSSRRLSLDSVMSFKQTFPRTKVSVSQNSNIQKTPIKFSQSVSLPSTPSIQQNLNHHTNEPFIELYGNNQNNILKNSNIQNTHDNLKFFSDPFCSQIGSQKKNVLHVGNGLSKKKPCLKLLPSLNASENNMQTNSYSSLPLLNFSSASGDHLTSEHKQFKDLSLSEVDEFLQEKENADKLLLRRNNNHVNRQLLYTNSKILHDRNYAVEKDNQDKRKIMDHQRLKFNSHDYQSVCEKKREPTDISLLNDTSFSSFDTDRFMADFKPWSPTAQESNDSIKISMAEETNFEEHEKFSITQKKVNYLTNNTDFSVDNKKPDVQQYYDTNLISKFADEFTKSQTISSVSAPKINQNISNSNSCPNIFKTPSNISISNPLNLIKKSEYTNNETNGAHSDEQNGITVTNCVEPQNDRPKRLLSLSDFWNSDSTKSLEEQLKIKLEEERFRREHCEQLIQNLQKKLLEQQEKIAVAVRLDNEKNSIICQFQASWKKSKQKTCELESEKENLEKLLKNVSEKHQIDINDCHEQIKTYKEELSKALNLATGYKEKSDSLIQEKIDLLKDHANELQNYKSHVQQAETRYEEIKVEYQKLLEKNQQTDETLKMVQQDLNKELLKSNEVRNEMTVIHKALDACETELIILRQEKESLQLKLKEEVNRNSILEQSKASLILTVNEAKESEKLAKNEIKSLTDQQEKLRAELRDVYQKQVDEVVKAKLQEFQTQLDSAEMIFQNEIETKQLAIAECAARKIKSVIDKHKLEISLVEEKHREEKKLYEIKVAQATQKAAMLDAQLNSYRKSKNQLVEQLHSMLQKQWQQALLIIAGGNGENMSSIQKISVDKLFSIPNEANLELIPKHCSTLHTEPMKLDTQKSSAVQSVKMQEHHNESFITLTSHDETPVTSRKESKTDLRKYIKMILDMQQSKEDHTKPKFFNGSPVAHKENSEKQSSAKDNTSNEGSSTWQPISEQISVHDTSEYLSVPQKFSCKTDRQKPPWK